MTKLFLASTFAATLLTGCVVDEPTYGSTEGESFEQWKSQLKREIATGKYIVDWDVVIGEERLYEHWEESQSGQALSIYRINGADIKWSDTQKINLTYCIGASFGANKQLIIDAMKGATEGGWEK